MNIANLILLNRLDSTIFEDKIHFLANKNFNEYYPNKTADFSTAQFYFDPKT